MISDKIIDIQQGLNTAFLNQNFQSNLAYRPQFIYNDNKNGQKVFSSIEEELLRCDSFAISVAFITRGGITPLLQTLKELELKHIPGRILTTDYLCFSDPGALDLILNCACTRRNALEMDFIRRAISSRKLRNIALLSEVPI